MQEFRLAFIIVHLNVQYGIGRQGKFLIIDSTVSLFIPSRMFRRWHTENCLFIFIFYFFSLTLLHSYYRRSRLGHCFLSCIQLPPILRLVIFLFWSRQQQVKNVLPQLFVALCHSAVCESLGGNTRPKKMTCMGGNLKRAWVKLSGPWDRGCNTKERERERGECVGSFTVFFPNELRWQIPKKKQNQQWP